MGDRGNIVVKHGDDQIWFYTHWCGSVIKETLKTALQKAPDRWTDPPYLARVVFQTLIGNNDGTTGFGISGSLQDNEHPILVCDCDTQTVYEVAQSSLIKFRLSPVLDPNGKAKTFKEFAEV